jgi:hypothetical protein
MGILAVPAFSQCPSDTASTLYNGLNGDLNDYALLFQGARNADQGCAQRAATNLYTKLGNIPTATWSQFLAGANVTYVMATAMEASGRGNLFGDLDARVRDVANNYQLGFASGDPCGFANGNWTGGNTCMDDYSIAASGWGWIAAFRRVTARDWSSSRDAAVYYIQQSLNPYDAICINMPGRALDSSSGPCNATVAELSTGAHIVSINHGNQTPAYGLGLMTSIAAAFVALDVIQAPVGTFSDLNADQRTIIDNLWIEAQASTDTGGNFLSAGCKKVDGGSSTGFDEGWPCWDQIGFQSLGYEDANGLTPYRAKFYPIKNFYTAYGFGTGSASLYQFDQFDDTFDPGNVRFFAQGRKETYNTLANTWVQAANRPPLTGNSEYKMNMIVAYTGWRVTAVGGGGGNVNADTFNTGDFETFWIYDMNGGQFNSGDPVTAKAFNGQYLRAVGGGGGALDAAGSFSDPNSQFTIIKMGGSSGTLIAGGDTFALRTPDGWHYVTAVSGGGGAVMANATGIGNDEIFMFNRPATY